MIQSLIAHLLWLYYSNHGNARHVLLAFYNWQQPGMSREWLRGYVRFLIIHYPHAMRHCLTALLHHRHYVTLDRVCP